MSPNIPDMFFKVQITNAILYCCSLSWDNTWQKKYH